MTHVAVVENGSLNAALKTEQQVIEDTESGSTYTVGDVPGADDLAGETVEVVSRGNEQQLYVPSGSIGGAPAPGSRGRAVAVSALQSLGMDRVADRVRNAGDGSSSGRGGSGGGGGGSSGGGGTTAAPPSQNGLLDLPPVDGTTGLLDAEDARIGLVKQLLTNLDAAGIDCPPELLMAMAIQETPTTDDGELFHNGGNFGRDADGIMQVTEESQHHEESGVYDNTVEGIENNIRDALTVFGDEYLNSYDTGCVCATIMYNGGSTFCRYYGPDSIRAYPRRVANELENRVPDVFGEEFANPDLVAELRAAQNAIDSDCQQVQTRCTNAHEVRMCREGGSSAAFWRVEFEGVITGGGGQESDEDTLGERVADGRLGSTCARENYDVVTGTGTATVTHQSGPPIRVIFDDGDPVTLESGASREFPSDEEGSGDGGDGSSGSGG